MKCVCVVYHVYFLRRHVGIIELDDIDLHVILYDANNKAYPSRYRMRIVRVVVGLSVYNTVTVSNQLWQPYLMRTKMCAGRSASVRLSERYTGARYSH